MDKFDQAKVTSLARSMPTGLNDRANWILENIPDGVEKEKARERIEYMIDWFTGGRPRLVQPDGNETKLGWE